MHIDQKEAVDDSRVGTNLGESNPVVAALFW